MRRPLGTLAHVLFLLAGACAHPTSGEGDCPAGEVAVGAGCVGGTPGATGATGPASLGSDAGPPATADGGKDAGPSPDGGEDAGTDIDAGMDAGSANPGMDAGDCSCLSPATCPDNCAGVTLAPRLQWNANDGYCGEVAFISAGLYYGQYLSQYDARALASGNAAQNLASSQLLIGVNDTTAAAGMHLNAVEWDTGTETDTAAFLAWVKGNVVSGYPVAIGVYTNEDLFYGTTTPNAGDPDYDHIVPVLEVQSNHPLDEPAVYYDDDTITFSDNGLWTGTASGQPQYAFSYLMGPFQATRAQANASTAAIYSVSSDNMNYGVAITGVTDPDHETLPVRVATNLNYEKPAIKPGSSMRPAAEALVLTITVSALTPGVDYVLYRYDSMTSVPDTAFNAGAANASEAIMIQIASGSTYVRTEDIMSDEIAVYRAVPASGP